MKYEWTAIDWNQSQSKPSTADEIDALIARLKELNASEEFPEGYEKLFPQMPVAPKPDPKLKARDQAMARALTFSGDYDCRALWLLY